MLDAESAKKRVEAVFACKGGVPADPYWSAVPDLTRLTLQVQAETLKWALGHHGISSDIESEISDTRAALARLEVERG